MDKITEIIAAMLKYSSGQLITEIDRTLEMGHEAQTRITNLVQQAQNKRLSVDLLTPKTLKQVFDHLQSQAEQSKLELLISKPPIPGMDISINTISMGLMAMSAMASSPLEAAKTVAP